MARQVKVQIGELSYTVEFLGAQGKRLQVRVNGQSAQVEVDGIELPPSLRTARHSAAAPMRAGHVAAEVAKARPQAAVPVSEKQITSPMNGRVVRISVQVGDRVRPGEEVCTLEAMKMEQSIRSSVAGVVKAVPASPGQRVTAGEVLVELE
ncbi:MAG: biotin/lipoyl-binding protein [Dehalococcoidia bacterium]|nr:biotin/lipoyl-binding protein [Dehalococcoidia bacterium]